MSRSPGRQITLISSGKTPYNMALGDKTIDTRHTKDSLKMQTIDRVQLSQFINDKQVLEGTVERPGLMLTPAGEIVKFFYRRKIISTATIFPQALQFESSSQKLLVRDIPAPIVKEIIYCQEIPVHMVIYDRLDGVDVRELCGSTGVECLVRLPGFLAHLHKIGIYFRAIHLGNILVYDDIISLVDISDLSVQKFSLGVFKRARNLAHLFNSEADKTFFVRYGVNKFIQEYIEVSKLGAAQGWLFEKRLRLALDSDMVQSAFTPPV